MEVDAGICSYRITCQSEVPNIISTDSVSCSRYVFNPINKTGLTITGDGNAVSGGRSGRTNSIIRDSRSSTGNIDAGEDPPVSISAAACCKCDPLYFVVGNIRFS